MGDLNTRQVSDASRLSFTRCLLDDLKALEIMLEKGQIESGITRIGAEQEFCLVDKNWRPTDNALHVLDKISDEHFTTELAKYNLEINLDPQELKGDAFTKMERQLHTLFNKAHTAAESEKSKVILSGIIPTITTKEMRLNYMTPMPRYMALNKMLTELRGSDFRLNLFGVDELSLKHDSVMFEACNTSFQMHLQIDPEDFTKSFNWAQAISGPVLGVCANSPILLGRELWAETRIALFQQSIDTRGVTKALKDQPSRVAFGDRWVTGSIVDLFKNEIARHKIILSQDISENSLDEIAAGRTPALKAVNLYNGTIYHWNRPCYGVGNGKAHIRIENRYIPAGPTPLDEMANLAFWVGLMKGRPAEGDKVHELMDFRDVKSNFIKAARYGSEAIMTWFGQVYSVNDLVLEKLLPIARRGLEKMQIDSKDIQRLLGVIEQRTKEQTGAQWTIKQFRALKSTQKHDDALVALTRTIWEKQRENVPVHQWTVNSTSPTVDYQPNHVGQIMTTQLYTAYSEDTSELTLNIMDWKGFHHLPIVDQNEALVGLLTATHVRRYKAKNDNYHHENRVSDIMVRQLHTAIPSMSIKEAIALMKTHEIGCLPVLQKGDLVGIVTIADIKHFDHD